MKKVFAVIPAMNESRNIGNVIKAVRKHVKNIVVIDDGSSDDTYDVAKAKHVAVLKHIINLGKGAALKTGCEFAIKNNATHMIFIDADMQHDPEEIPNFLKALKKYDMVFGYRKMTKSMPFILRFGNWCINRSTKYLYGLEIYDTTCGYRAITAKAYKKIRWETTGYFVEAEMIANVGKEKISYTQIPIKTIYSDKYKGTTVLDGVKIVINMLMWRLRR
ncbi:MAG: glycosyltransferase family 2 protein [Candidatus Woesearchaeota archaeon]|jgi:glycosyltransferase involved in cell wall biosynthesis|nr:glycosyltransferase family 2 protein [Candidatus Woesearchaeota archaeon]MDP7324183.1 glycosyltransferase family 2 protein [Candidatus Woesearchaeota archaeon]MDP7458353.1 glycosyltransferase family 2 protein [Candidatus Woesearchaeota archaeon]|tara:strand:+ start:100 stop:756 length:657 start_codon:yes stop_codon:yes gene_type:complete